MFKEIRTSILSRLALIQILTIIGAASFSLFFSYGSYKRESEILLQKYIEQILPKLERLHDTLISYKLMGLDKAYDLETKELMNSFPITSIKIENPNKTKPDEPNCFFYKPTITNNDLPKIKVCINKIAITKSIPILKNAVPIVIGFSVLFILIAFYSAFFIYLAVLRPLKQFKQALALANNSQNLNINNIRSQGEIQEFIKVTSALWTKSAILETQAQMSTLARQVAHDIRSPLSALNMVASTLDQVPEERRLLIRNAISRINDIANTLLQKSKSLNSQASDLSSPQTPGEPTLHFKTELLSALIDTIVSEKRMQFRNQIGVHIDVNLSSSYGAFAQVDSTELKRVMSNLINNSVEAFSNQKGQIAVVVKKLNESTKIIISDNGKGIPSHLLEQLGQVGVSHGKEHTASGSGLGIYHAKKTIERFGGQFQIESKEGQGTTITMTLPKINAPPWFTEKLIIDSKTRIISVDDDLSIHGLWRGRVQSLGAGSLGGVEHLSFTSADEFKKWFHTGSQSKIKKNLFLMDYELLNQSQTGLDLIEELGISDQSLLVTSRYEEDNIKERCSRLNVRLIPKTMAGFVPIDVTNKSL